MYLIYGIAAFFVVLLLFWVFIIPHHILQKHYFIQKNSNKVIDISKADDLYQQQTDLLIAHISDTHFSAHYRPHHFNPVIRSILKTSPDLIIFTGDLLQTYKKWPHRYSQRLIEKLSRIHAKMGKLAILGDQDYLDDGHFFVEEVLKKSGFTILKNEEIFGSDDTISINVTGIDDVLKGHPKFDYEATLAEWHLLLIHEANSIQQVPRLEKYDLVLAGQTKNLHTSRRVPHYSTGLYLLKPSTILSISNGLRHFFSWSKKSTPEIIYYHLKNKKNDPQKLDQKI